MVPIDVIKLVAALTHHKNEPRVAYYERVKEAGPLAVMIKLADIADNLSPERLDRLDPETQDRLKAKYAKAIEALNPIEAVGGQNDRNPA
jgi:hypothetical protein